MTAVPTPAIFAKKAPLVAKVSPSEPAKIVRPGTAEDVVTSVHDGVVKTKHLKPGQSVRAFVRGEPRGSVHVVSKIERLEGGALWRVEFSSGHPTLEYKAAYRWFDESLVGSVVQHVVKRPALVAYEEV